MRGTDADSHKGERENRFIPACAGNGRSTTSPRCARPVHPRVCGERSNPSSRRPRTPGSSPRVRGTAPISASSSRRCRFIPACAGNGNLLCAGASRRTVHPRVCGERPTTSSPAYLFFGSSPRVRGTVYQGLYHIANNRFIPACAGNGCCAKFPVRLPPVHPRVCGERILPTYCHATGYGSSPRVRGTVFDASQSPRPS